MADEFDYLSPSFGKEARPVLRKQAIRVAPVDQTAPAAPVDQAEPAVPAVDNLDYLGSGKAPPDNNAVIENSKREDNLWAGGQLGALAGSAGPIARGVGSFVEDKGADLLAKALSRVPGLAGGFNTTSVPEEGSTPGGKYSKKTKYGIGEGAVEDVVNKYNRTKNKGKYTKKLDALYGVKRPGEPDSLIDRLIQRNANTEAAAREAVLAKIANKPSFLKALSGAGKNVGTLAGSTAFGALHGMNAADQAQQAMDTWGTNKAEAVGHAVSGLGSTADLVSNFLPEVWRQGVRKYVSPLAMVGSGAADVVKGYGEVSEPMRYNPPLPSQTETQSDYDKRVLTGKLRMPSAVARIGLGVLNPVAGFASMLPPLSPEYAVQNPEQVRKWIEAGAYDTADEQLDRARGAQPPLSFSERGMPANYQRYQWKAAPPIR